MEQGTGGSGSASGAERGDGEALGGELHEGKGAPAQEQLSGEGAAQPSRDTRH